MCLVFQRFHYLLHEHNCYSSSYHHHHPLKTRPTLSQVCASSLRSNPRGAVRDAEEERGHSYLVYFFQFLPLLLLQEPKRFSSYKIAESWFNRKPVNVGRGDGLKASRPADALLWRFKDLARSAETRRNKQQSIRFLNDYYFTLDVFTRRHPGIFSVMDKSRECGMSKAERHSDLPPGRFSSETEPCAGSAALGSLWRT